MSQITPSQCLLRVPGSSGQAQAWDCRVGSGGCKSPRVTRSSPAGCQACPAGGPGPASRSRGPPGLLGSGPAPPRGAVPAVSVAALCSSPAGLSQRDAEAEAHRLAVTLPSAAAPTRVGSHGHSGARWVGSATACLCQPPLLPGTPSFGPLITTGRKFPEPLPGGRRHLSEAHPVAGILQVSVSRSASQATWQGPRMVPASQDPYSGDRVFQTAQLTVPRLEALAGGLR